MSRTSLHRPRPPRAVWLRSATDTRLLPTLSQHTTNYKRCPKAHRLRLHSDQSLSPPVYVTGYGRSPDIVRLALFKGNCRICAPLTRRTTPAHSTGEADRPHYTGLSPGAIAPPAHSPVAYLGVLPLPSDGSEDALPPPLRLPERMWDLIPFLDSPVVAFGEAMPHSDGRESTPPYLRMAGHFWWSRLPHTEIISRLLHVLSEARGCRRAGANVQHPLSRTTPIGTGVAAFLRKSPGPSIPSPSSSVIPAPLLHPSGPRAGIHPLLPLNLGCRKSAYGKREPIPSHVGPTGWSPSLHHRKEPSPSDK